MAHSVTVISISEQVRSTDGVVCKKIKGKRPQK